MSQSTLHSNAGWLPGATRRGLTGLATLLVACTSQQSVNVNTGSQGDADLRNSAETSVTPTVAVGVGPGATASANGAPGAPGAPARGAASGSGSALGTTGGAAAGAAVGGGAKTDMVFSEDFQRTGLGLVPAGWTTDDGVGVVTQGRSKCLGVMQRGEHQMRTPPITWPASFRIEMDVATRDDSTDYFRFSVVGIEALFGGSMEGGKLTNASDVWNEFRPYKGKRAVLAFERLGQVLRSSVDGKQLLMSRKSDMQAFGTIPLTIAFYGANPMCIHRITVRAQ